MNANISRCVTAPASFGDETDSVSPTLSPARRHRRRMFGRHRGVQAGHEIHPAPAHSITTRMVPAFLRSPVPEAASDTSVPRPTAPRRFVGRQHQADLHARFTGVVEATKCVVGLGRPSHM